MAGGEHAPDVDEDAVAEVHILAEHRARRGLAPVVGTMSLRGTVEMLKANIPSNQEVRTSSDASLDLLDPRGAE
jgi:hypothetical protein